MRRAEGRQASLMIGVSRLFSRGTTAGVREGDLLDQFALHGDQAAFEALLNRHGPMVLATCRRWLRDQGDIEDAFQGTFLVLVRRASSLQRRETLGPWLHGVAKRVAQRASKEAGRRNRIEAQGRIDGCPKPADQSLLDPERSERDATVRVEVDRLPARYRMPITLCYLEGRSHEEAAELLACPLGTVKGRLARARTLLKKRLIRKGLAPALAATIVSTNPSPAAITPLLRQGTIHAARSLEKCSHASSFTSSHAVSLMNGVLRAMFLTKVKIASALMVVPLVSLFAFGVAWGPAGAQDQKKGATAKEPLIAPEGFASQKLAFPPPRVDPKIQELRKKRADLAKARFDIERRRFLGGQTSISGTFEWSVRRLEAELAFQQDDEKARIAALKAHKERMAELQKMSEVAVREERKPQSDLDDANYYLIDAEIRLAEAKEKQAAADVLKAAIPFPDTRTIELPAKGKFAAEAERRLKRRPATEDLTRSPK